VQYKEQKISSLVDPISQGIRLRSKPETIQKRAVWQLHRYLLQAPPGMATFRELDDTTEEEIERIDQMLQEEILPEPPRWVVEKACALVRERCLTDLLLSRPGEDKQDILGGHGALVSNLLELAAVLGIPADVFSRAVKYMQYHYLDQCLNSVTQGEKARAISKSISYLESEIKQCLAQSQVERILIDAESTIDFMESLGKYHIIHDEEKRKVIMNFSIHDTCNSLAQLGISMPQDWEKKAERLDQKFGCVRDFFDLTVLRGKDLASSLIEAMKKRNKVRGVLYCDAYLHENLARWFQAHNVSYSFLFPNFSL
jgi:hypothetical protein